MVPLITYNEKNMTTESLVERLVESVREEVFPIMDYCDKYWEDTDDFLSYKADVPAYFLETDEGKEESLQEIEIQANETEAKTYSVEQLKNYEFLLKNFYTVDSTTTVTSSELNGEKLASKDLSIDFNKEEPKILIYHTHGSENFADSKNSDKSETIIGTGDELTRILEEKYQIKTYHDRSFYDMINGKLDRSKAYTYAGNGVKRILEKFPSIEVVIDLHRDAVKEGTKLVTKVNGADTAKIMFFNGLSRTAKNGDITYLQNPNKEDNLAFSLQMQLKAADLYPGLTRKIYLKGYRYNLHLKPRSLLVEVGAQTNTKEEAKNAMEPLAELLYQVLKK
ncbi:MAG: stage II sporulation protein P [Lachnospiraceae bacterium]|nr:stage II sporulation protein P [Lachnospiraceae bacterium]